jgi:hypothetical protein
VRGLPKIEKIPSNFEKSKECRLAMELRDGLFSLQIELSKVHKKSVNKIPWKVALPFYWLCVILSSFGFALPPCFSLR